MTNTLYFHNTIRDGDDDNDSVSTTTEESPATSRRHTTTATPVAMEKVDSKEKLYSRMRLWEFPDQFVVEPIEDSSGSCLAISRLDGSMKLIDELPKCTSPPPRTLKARRIFGVVGTLKLLAGVYVLVITEHGCVGSYMGHPIFRVSSLKVLPCDHSLKTSPTEQKKMESAFSMLLRAAERTSGLYFSYDVDLTLTAQRLHSLGGELKTLPLWRQADPKFVWNNYMMESLIDNKLNQFLLPVIQGSFQTFQATIGKETIDVTLIARRCTRRTGTRLWTRGADSDGYVANFVESEQIVQLNGFTASFVQHGREGYLSEKYASAMQNLVNDNIRYLHFDFERISILYEQIEGFLKKNGYFFLNPKGEKVEEQLGVVRTNCVDCLDRTNVTQSMIGRKMLESQLHRMGVFAADVTISKFSHFDDHFKIMWANHGDDISIQYSGTPALKGDFVRCGKRTVQGILKDGWNAMARYYMNNFSDGSKQDAIDLLQGHYIISVNRDASLPTQKGGLESIASLRLAFALGLAGLLFASMSLKQARTDFRHIFFSLIWASLSLGITAFVKANGRVFCNRPRLHKPRT